MSVDRERLKDICFEVYQEACERIDGLEQAPEYDRWDLTFQDLFGAIYQANGEFELALAMDSAYYLRAGEVLRIMVECIDKAGRAIPRDLVEGERQ